MTTAVTVAEKSHAELGASVAARWIACPGSVRLSRGRDNISSEYAQEGTAAHALGELALRNGPGPEVFVGTTLEGVEVTEEMADFVRVYVDYCQAQKGRFISTWIERSFNLGALNPPGPMFGTADFTAYDPILRRLHVTDLKYGQGVLVQVKGNIQLRYYALGALLSLPKGTIVDEIEITVVQPRMLHPDGVIRSETITLAELIEFSIELLDAARATQAPDAPLHAGAHCKFCPASGACPELVKHAQEVAQIEFGVVDLPPAPETLPIALRSEILAKLPVLEQWIKDMKSDAYRRLLAGEDVPGFKLVQKRNTRFWLDEKETEQYLRAEGRETEEIFDLKLKSPAQVEKLVGKKNLPKDLVGSKSSGHTMAPVHDVRAAVSVDSGDEFFALASGDLEE